MKNDVIKAAVVGASGYAGGELLRLLLAHAQVDLTEIVSNTYVGQPLAVAFPGMSLSDKCFTDYNPTRIIQSCNLVFFAQDHGVAMREVKPFLDAGLKVIDLSADFRLRDKDKFSLWYKHQHSASDLLDEAVYGLPELFREQIRKASLVANPGCYPTASGLALIPLIEEKLIDLDSIVIDAKSGVSGAGRGKHSLDFHFPELNENFRAYGVAGTHRHTPEIEQTLSFAARSEVIVSFTPHLLPITRGILASCYAKLLRDIPSQDLRSLYKKRYDSHPFVRILNSGSLPNTKACYGSNLCLISPEVDKRSGRVNIFSAIDNLNKGAAGQAVQNMNLMFDLDEKAGLNGAGLWP